MAALVEGKAVRITDGNVRHKHIPVGPILDLFPEDTVGGSNKSDLGSPITIHLNGIGTFETDIAGDKKLLRIRSDDAIGEFYKRNGAIDGSVVFFEKIGHREFRVSIVN